MQPDIPHIHNIHNRVYTLPLTGSSKGIHIIRGPTQTKNTTGHLHGVVGTPLEGAWGPLRPWDSPSTDSAPSFFAPCHFLSGELSEFQWLSCTPGQGCWTWTKLLNPVETWLCFPNLVNFSVMVSRHLFPFQSPPLSPLNSAFVVLPFIHAWPYGWIFVVWCSFILVANLFISPTCSLWAPCQLQPCGMSGHSLLADF